MTLAFGVVRAVVILLKDVAITKKVKGYEVFKMRRDCDSLRRIAEIERRHCASSGVRYEVERMICKSCGNLKQLNPWKWICERCE